MTTAPILASDAVHHPLRGSLFKTPNFAHRCFLHLVLRCFFQLLCLPAEISSYAEGSCLAFRRIFTGVSIARTSFSKTAAARASLAVRGFRNILASKIGIHHFPLMNFPRVKNGHATILRTVLKDQRAYPFAHFLLTIKVSPKNAVHSTPISSDISMSWSIRPSVVIEKN